MNEQFTNLQFTYDDGGRAAAGFKGEAGDCVCRAIAIATKSDYRVVYDSLNGIAANMRQTKRVRGASSRNGVPRSVYEQYLRACGWVWVPTMLIGQGCKVHLKSDELPSGRIIARLSRHLVAVIDGVIHDIYDCSRDGTRCVYGYWRTP
jgi:hypothetical protein